MGRGGRGGAGWTPPLRSRNTSLNLGPRRRDNGIICNSTLKQATTNVLDIVYIVHEQNEQEARFAQSPIRV